MRRVELIHAIRKWCLQWAVSQYSEWPLSEEQCTELADFIIENVSEEEKS
jgi:hypothetical protein